MVPEVETIRTAAVIPARDEAATIHDVVVGTVAQVDRVFVVDDGSRDATASIVEGLPVTAIRHATSQGKAAALGAGFRAALAAGAELVVTLDGDGQHDPREISRLLAAARAFPGHLVLGARLRDRRNAPLIRRCANRYADFWLSWASAQRVPDSQTGFRVYPRALIETVLSATERRRGFVFESAVVIDGARAGFPTVAVPVANIHVRASRPSHFRPVRDVLAIFWMVWWKMWRRLTYPQGLWRILWRPAKVYDPQAAHVDASKRTAALRRR